jgi:hypothetical protein
MGNNLVSNPIVLDTVGAVMTGRLISIYSVQWVDPTNVGDAIFLKDQYDNIIFKATCVVSKQSLIKYFEPGFNFVGLNLSALTSGEVHILTNYVQEQIGKTLPYKD